MSESESSNYDHSICEDMKDLIEQWESIPLLHDTIVESLTSLRRTLTVQPGMGFHVAIEELHVEILQAIEQGKEVSFATRLIEVVDAYRMKE
uniref:Uncharacterized protein n=1 Tax=viral metagenome TaxID=1070528 RepID=A0A6C0KR14_9ZZZZ